jgi:uncharacterized membrane protein (DUF2068 family)
MTSHRDRGLELIALFKMMKAILLLLAGAGVFSLLRPTAAAVVREWLSALVSRHGLLFFRRALEVFDSARPARIQLLGLASISYALLFGTEGVGLWMEKRWAEYLTVFATGSLIPFELYELTRRLTIIRVLALLVNVAAIVYLIYRLRHPRREQAEAKQNAPPLTLTS